jgi:hypothetical protein
MDTSDKKEEPDDALAALEKENDRLRSALAFYAKATTNDFNFERGNLARTTLNGKCPTTPQRNLTPRN